MWLLKQNFIKKKEIDKIITYLEFDTDNSKKYKIQMIKNSAVYAIKLELGQLLALYYLVFWKNYLKENKIKELLLGV